MGIEGGAHRPTNLSRIESDPWGLSVLSDRDRVLIESLVAQDSPQELGFFYADEVPDGVSEEGFRFLMDLCQFRIYRSNPSSMLDEAGATSRVAWEYSLRVGPEWPGFDRPPPTAFRA